MRILIITVFFILGNTTHVGAQILTEWHGQWHGMMHMFRNGRMTDSVDVILTIKPLNDSTLTWKTEYKSDKQPMTKDYTMKSVDIVKGVYATDEGEGVLLDTYLIDHTLFNVFEVEGILLTATYRLLGDEINFEVTSGKKGKIVAGGVTNFSVNFVQRVRLRRVENTMISKGDEPVYFIEGKRISKEEMNSINPGDIESVDVFKGEHAIKKFGSSYKNGVIVIKLKIK